MLRIENVKAIVVDLDRTLLHTDKTVSPYTISVLKACRERGMKLMVATARPLRDVTRFCEEIGFDAMTVSNGGRVLCGAKRTEFGIPRACAVRVLHALQRDPTLRITLETGDRAYSNQPIAEYETILTEDLAAIAAAEGTMKILVHLDHDHTLAAVQKELTEELYWTVANGYLLQIMNKAATKWNGIKAMLEISGGTPAQTIYFGDDYDDLEPLKLCGIGVAVSNAIEEAKAAADYVADSNDEDGVAKFLTQLLKQPVTEWGKE